MNKNKLLDSTELTNGNNFNLNKTEEIINNGPNISRISRTSLKKSKKRKITKITTMGLKFFKQMKLEQEK